MVQGAFDELDPPGFVTAVEIGPDGRKQPGLSSRTHARLRRGLANTRELYQWFGGVLRGEPDRRPGAIVLAGEDGEELSRWDFDAAFPVRLRMATLTEDTLFEVDELELAVEGWRRHEEPPAEKPPAGEPPAVASPDAAASDPEEGTLPPAT